MLFTVANAAQLLAGLDFFPIEAVLLEEELPPTVVHQQSTPLPAALTIVVLDVAKLSDILDLSPVAAPVVAKLFRLLAVRAAAVA